MYAGSGGMGPTARDLSPSRTVAPGRGTLDEEDAVRRRATSAGGPGRDLAEHGGQMPGGRLEDAVLASELQRAGNPFVNLFSP